MPLWVKVCLRSLSIFGIIGDTRIRIWTKAKPKLYLSQVKFKSTSEIVFLANLWSIITFWPWKYTLSSLENQFRPLKVDWTTNIKTTPSKIKYAIYQEAYTLILLKPQSLEFNGGYKVLFEPILNQNKPNQKHKIAQTMS